MTTKSAFLNGRSDRGIILPMTIIIMMLFALMAAALLGFGVNERTAASSQILTARAFAAAEAGAQKAYYYLTTSGPGGTPVDGSTWRTTGYAENLPAPNSADSFTVTVQDGTGAQVGNAVIVSTATVSGHQRRIQMIVAGSGSLGSNAISTTGTIGNYGIVSGNAAGTASGNPGTTVESGSWKPPISRLPKVNLNGLRAKAQAEGYYFKGEVTTRVSGGVVTMSDNYGHTATLPTTLTTTGDDTTGTVNVIFIDNSSPTANDGGFSLNGNYTLGGFIVSMGASTLQSADDTFGGTYTVNGVVYSPGDIRLNGGGNATNLTGGILAAQSVEIRGNHDRVTYDATKMKRAGGASSYQISWTELN